MKSESQSLVASLRKKNSQLNDLYCDKIDFIDRTFEGWKFPYKYTGVLLQGSRQLYQW